VGLFLVILLLAVIAIILQRHRAPEAQSIAGPAQATSPDQTARPEAKPGDAVPVPQSAPAAAPVLKPRAAKSSGDVLQQVLPDVPASAKRTIRGAVRVEVRVALDSSGKVSGATLISPGPSKYFANLALEAARKWKFAPAGTGRADSTRNRIMRFEFRQSGTRAQLLSGAQRSEE